MEHAMRIFNKALLVLSTVACLNTSAFADVSMGETLLTFDIAKQDSESNHLYSMSASQYLDLENGLELGVKAFSNVQGEDIISRFCATLGYDISSSVYFEVGSGLERDYKTGTNAVEYYAKTKIKIPDNNIGVNLEISDSCSKVGFELTF